MIILNSPSLAQVKNTITMTFLFLYLRNYKNKITLISKSPCQGLYGKINYHKNKIIMNKKIRNSVFAGGMTFVFALNFLVPNVVKAKGIAYGDQIQSSNTSREAIAPDSNVSAVAGTVLLAVMVVSAIVDGLHATDDVSANIQNLD